MPNFKEKTTLQDIAEKVDDLVGGHVGEFDVEMVSQRFQDMLEDFSCKRAQWIGTYRLEAAYAEMILQNKDWQHKKSGPPHKGFVWEDTLFCQGRFVSGWIPQKIPRNNRANPEVWTLEDWSRKNRENLLVGQYFLLSLCHDCYLNRRPPLITPEIHATYVFEFVNYLKPILPEHICKKMKQGDIPVEGQNLYHTTLNHEYRGDAQKILESHVDFLQFAYQDVLQDLERKFAEKQNTHVTISQDEKTEKAEPAEEKTNEFPPSVLKARSAYDYAIAKIPVAGEMTYKEIYDKLSLDPKIESDMLPDNAETFEKYLRRSGLKRYRKRQKPNTTRSIRPMKEF